jgi:hypothetical protein
LQEPSHNASGTFEYHRDLKHIRQLLGGAEAIALNLLAADAEKSSRF